MRKTILSGAVALSVLGASGARADLTIVQKTSVSGMPTGVSNGQGITTTLYVKGNKTRTETMGEVVLNDGTRTFYLNNEKKTYSVITNARLQSEGMEAAGPMADQFKKMMDISMDASVKPGGKKRTILGRPASNYIYSIRMKMNFKKGSGPTGATGVGPMTLPTITMSGELWTTTTISLPAVATRSPAQMAGIFRRLGVLSGSAQKISKAFSIVKGYPLESTMTQSFAGAKGMPGMPSEPMSTKTQVTSLKTDALPDSLFAVPAGYKQVPYESRMPAGMPGMGGPGM